MISFATWSLLEHDRFFLAGSLSAAAESQTERITIPLRLPTAGRPLRLCEKKKEKKYGAQRRQAAKKGSLSAAAESQTERTIISLRLPTAGRPLHLCDNKKEKKNRARKDAKPQRVRRGGK